MIKRFLFSIIAGIFLVGCSDPDSIQVKRKVYIKKEDNKYILYKDNQPFQIKGAGGFSNLSLLKNIGGNAIRTWDTTNLLTVLDSAQANHISVVVGLPFQNSNIISLYSDQAKIAAQHDAFKKIIIRFKDHPAILMWCVGNELDFPYHWSYNGFYKAFNELTEMIHQQDPGHPVTTTVLNFNKKYIANLQLRCDIDLISFNLFSNLKTLRKDLKDFSWFWRGPYLILEWGTDGPWEGTEQTAWGAYIEATSRKKAEIYQNRYLQHMPVENPRYLGSFVFFWGNKQETTHTWFSMFDKHGAKSEPVNVIKYLWTGKYMQEAFPQLDFMLVNGLGARNNIILNPGTAIQADLVFLNDFKNIKYVSWQIFKEDWYKISDINNIRILLPISSLSNAGLSPGAKLLAPDQEGPYRIFATVYNHQGNFATCNTPFYVINK